MGVRGRGKQESCWRQEHRIGSSLFARAPQLLRASRRLAARKMRGRRRIVPVPGRAHVVKRSSTGVRKPSYSGDGP